MFMHPGIQRVFLNTLMSFENHQFFLTTHSNHFLDITLDVTGVSVFTFRKQFEDLSHKEKEANFEIENVSSGDSSCLELLGVRNSSVFLSNCTIWVEGITDRRYLAHYLKLYIQHRASTESTTKEYKEDLHYSFVEYGGANVTHWSFLDNVPDAIDVERLCSRLFLVADKDSLGNSAKEQRHEKLRNALGARFHLLGCREIENLLGLGILEAVVELYEKTPPQFHPVHRKDYATKPLGTFIEKELLASPKTRTGSYASANGSVTNKVDFCDKAVKVMTSYDDLSAEAKEIAEKMFNFIAANNR
jgi:predicted ATP-dependent endonuclease of OLD family